MARQDSPRDSDDTLAEVQTAARALNDAINSLTRSVVETSTRTSQDAVTGSMRKAARSLSAAAERLGGGGGSGEGSAKGGNSRGRSEATRQRLLEAAGRVFAAKGYEGASVSDIAAAAGFTKGAFYASFSSKEEVFLEVARLRCGAEEDGGSQGSDWQYDLADVPIEDVLLQLEFCLYAVRHEGSDSRGVLVDSWHRSFEAVAAQVARHKGRDAAAEEDVETAFALVAVGLLGAIIGAATSSEETNPMVQGAWARLLDAPDSPGGPDRPDNKTS